MNCIMHTIEPNLRQLSLPDEDAVCMFESPRSAYLQDPLLFARSFDLRPKTEIMTVLLRTFKCRSSLSVCWAVDHPGYFGKQCGMLLFVPSSQLANTSRQILHERMR